jgi:hypothetical protein
MNNEIIFATTLNATKIRLTPNGDVKNLRLEVFACSDFGRINEMMFSSLYLDIVFYSK